MTRDASTIEEFYRDALAFLEAHAAPRADGPISPWGAGPDGVVAIGDPQPAGSERERVAAARAWRALAFDAGLAWPNGPKEYGGGGLPAEFDDEYARLEARFDVPDQAIFSVGWHVIGRVLLEHGSEDAKDRYLRALYRGDVIGCQLLSEPDAGSDLPSLRTTAVRDGDTWVVDGQKVWCSAAHLAGVGQLLARTEPDLPRHAGLTMFLVDMAAPGVEIRPLRQMSGDLEFSEVFLSGVRVPDSQRLGPRGEGWRAATTTLVTERAAVGAGRTSADGVAIARVFQLANHVGADDPLSRQALAELYIVDRIVDWLGAGGLPADRIAATRQSSLLKIHASDQLRRISRLATRLLGPQVGADTGEWGTFAWGRFMCGAPGRSIAGGTDEIQRTILGERVLGLPREPQ